MLNASNNCKNAIKSLIRSFSFYVIANGTDEISANDIFSIEIEENGSSSQAISIGDFNRNQLTMTVREDAYSKWEGGYLSIYCKCNGIDEKIPLGKYYVSSTEVKDNLSKLEIIAYDVPNTINEKVENLSSKNVQEIITTIENLIGMQLINKSLITLNTVNAIPTDCTYMQLLGYFAGYNGYNIRTNRNGNLELYKFSASNVVDTIGLSDIYMDSNSYKYEPTTIGSIVVVNGDAEYSKGTGLSLKYENPFITSTDEVPSDYLNLTYYSASFSARGNPLYQIGDAFYIGMLNKDSSQLGKNFVLGKAILGSKEKRILCLNMHQKISIDGGMKMSIDSYTNKEKQLTIGESPTMKKINSVKNDVVKAMREAMTSLIGTNNGYFSFLDKNGNPLTFEDILKGKVAIGFQDTDSPTITTTTKGWKFTEGGLGYSKDGMKTFIYGLDKEGHINGSMLSLESITEDKLSKVLNKTITDASENASDALQKYGDLDTKVTQQFNVYDNKFNSVITMETLNTLDVAGRNYVLNSDVQKTDEGDGKPFNYSLSKGIEHIEYYTISIYIENSLNLSYLNLQIGNINHILDSKLFDSKNNRYVLTFQTIKDETGQTSISIYPHYSSSTSSNKCIVSKVKLEKGETVTNYSRAPEDNVTNIQMQSAIKQSVDEINLSVSKKVGKDEIIAAINLSSESATIKASKLNLEFGNDSEKMTMMGNTTGVLFKGSGTFTVNSVGNFYLANYVDTTYNTKLNSIFSYFDSQTNSQGLRLINYKKDNPNRFSNYICLYEDSNATIADIHNYLKNSTSVANYIQLNATKDVSKILISNFDTSGSAKGSIELVSNRSDTSAGTIMIRGGSGNNDMWIGVSKDLSMMRYGNYTDRFELNSTQSIMAHGSQAIYVTNSNGIIMYVGNVSRLSIGSDGRVSAYNGANSGYAIVSTAISGGDGMHPIAFGWSGSTLSAFVDNNYVWGTSDRRLKKDIEQVNEEFIDAIGEIEIKQFRFSKKPYDTEILHFGVIAQELRESMKKHNLSLDHIAVTGTFKNGGDDTEYYSVDKEEFMMARIAYDEKRIKKLEEKLKS